MLLLTLLAPFYCTRVIETPHALVPVLALAPAILFACLGSVYRGYYEGLQNMIPTAASEVVEAVVKLGLGLFASYWVVSACTTEYAELGTVFSLSPASPDEAMFLPFPSRRPGLCWELPSALPAHCCIWRFVTKEEGTESRPDCTKAPQFRKAAGIP